MTAATAAFWDKIARTYAARPVADEAAYATTLDRTRAHLRPTDRVLEIGAGTATTALKLAPHVAQYTASDFSAEMVSIGRKKAAAAGAGNLTVVQGVLGDAVLGDGPFDAVLAFNLLHLIRDPGAEARKARARLRPGGLFVSKTATLADRAWALWPVIGLMRLIGKAPYVHFLTARGLDRAITEAGFTIIETGAYPTRFLVARAV